MWWPPSRTRPFRKRRPPERRDDGEYWPLVDLLPDRVCAVQSRLKVVVRPTVRERECLLWLLVLEPWLHEHGVDLGERVSFEFVEEPCPTFALHG